MKLITTLVSIFILLSISAQEITDVIYPTATDENEGTNVCFSDTRAIYTVGEFKGEIDLGGNTVIANSKRTAFITKRNQDGSFDWMNTIMSTNNVFIEKILVDQNRVFVGGVYSDSLFIGTDTLINTVQKGIYVGVYDTLGVYQYSLNPECNSGKLMDMALSNSNELYISGDYFNLFEFAGQTYDSPLGKNCFVLKYDLSNLNESWFTASTGTNTNAAKVKVDSNGDVIIIGSYGSGAVIGGMSLLDNGTEHNTYIAKFDNQGNFKWVETIVGLDQIHGFGLEIDNDDNIYACGEFELNVSLPDGSTLNTSGLMDGLIYKMNSNGDYQWAKQIGGIDTDTGIDVVKDISGNPILLLNAGRDLDYASINMDPYGFSEPLIVKLNKNDGSYIWHKRIPSLFQSGVVTANSIAISDSLICVTGANYTGIEFNNNVIVSNNLFDVFLVLIDDNDYAEYASIDQVNENTFSIYPNPFSSELNVFSDQEMKKIEIYTLDGKIVYSIDAKGLQEKILPNINSGSYILKIETEKTIITNKINHL